MAKSTKDVPVLLITGYLGSGKTTLLNHILGNEEGIKFAVIVNDIGEVNIDADLIQHGGVVNQKNDSLVALQNGCICCTLQNDLIEQIYQLLKMQCFDYIVIEASGVCDPVPIAQTLCSIPQLGAQYRDFGFLRLDCITTVVDALRMKDEFNCADKLNPLEVGEDDIENLLIQQIEFCNLVLLNKASEVTSEELTRIKKIIRALQPEAEIIECDYADVDLKRLVNTHTFSFNQVAGSAGWMKEISKFAEEEHTGHEEEEQEHHCHHDHDGEECHCHHEQEGEEECHCHHDHDDEDGEEHEHHHHHHDGECGCHCHHHHHHNENGETEEYGIGTYVYFRRRPFDMNKFDFFVTKVWPSNIIRVKGLCYFEDEFDMSYIFEQAGSQKQLTKFGRWYATMPEAELEKLMDAEPGLAHDWDPKYGDRMQKLVFIGQNLNKEELSHQLDFCLADEKE